MPVCLENAYQAQDEHLVVARSIPSTPRHLMVHIDGAIKLANPLVSGQADPYTE